MKTRITTISGGLGIRSIVQTSDAAVHAPGLLLIHGFLDCADNWDDVMTGLVRQSDPWPVVAAVDLRGHGRSAHVGKGAFYNFVDYQCDVDAVLDDLDQRFGSRKWILLGHSMGGGIAALYAGLRPERVATLAILEGIHVPDTSLEYLPEHTRLWLQDHKKWSGRKPVPLPSLDEAARRFGLTAGMDDDLLRRKVRKLVVKRSGQWYWRYDPRHRARFALPYLASVHRVFWQQIRSPTWLIEGEKSGFRGLADDRLDVFANLKKELWPDVGHFMHWQKPEQCVRLVRQMRASLRP